MALGLVQSQLPARIHQPAVMKSTANEDNQKLWSLVTRLTGCSVISHQTDHRPQLGAYSLAALRKVTTSWLRCSTRLSGHA